MADYKSQDVMATEKVADVGVMSELKQLVVKQKQLAKVATDKKKQLFRDRQQLFVNIDKDNTKISVNLIRSLKNTMLALYYEDTLSVKVSSRNIFDTEQAENLNNLFEYIHDEMDMDMWDYDNQGNRIEYGVGIRIMTGWDEDNHLPIYKVIHPMSMFPDPKGYLHINNFDFIGFELDVDLEEIKNNKDFYNVKELEGWMSSEQTQNNTAQMQYRDIDNQDNTRSQNDIGRTTLYYHYNIYNGQPVQSVWAAGETICLSAKVIKPLIYKDANKHKKMKYPVVLNYFEPRKGDPRGICLYDIAEDKQKFMTLFYNLMSIKAQREALGGKFFVDTQVYTANKTQLLKPTVGPQYLPVDTNGGPISNLVYAVPQDPISPDVYNFPNIMKQQTTEDVGISDLTRGVGTATGQTATEVQLEQQNQNIQLLLGGKINSFGEKQRWKLIYIYYYYYFGKTDKKFIQINRGIATVGDEISRDDIIGPAEPNIEIASKAASIAQENKNKADFNALFPQLIADPSISPISKRFLTRQALRYAGYSRQQVEATIQLTPEEMQAKQDLMFLNRNLPVNIDNMDEDHYTYIVIYQSALDTPAKTAAITARQQAYIMSGQQARQSLMGQQQGQGSGAAGANIMMNNANQQSKNQPSSAGMQGQQVQ